MRIASGPVVVVAVVAVVPVAALPVAAVVVPVALGVALGEVVVLQRGGRGGVDLVLGAGVGDRLVDGGLQALEVDDRVGLLDRPDLLGGEFEVVRLDAGGGEVGDLHVLAAYPAGEELHRVEGRDDVQLALRALGAATAAAGRQGEAGGEGGGGQGYGAASTSSDHHDNHSQIRWK